MPTPANQGPVALRSTGTSLALQSIQAAIVALQNPDFVRLADSFGVASFKATDAAQLEEALHKAFALDAPALVHVPHGDVPSPWDLIMMPRVRG